MTNGDHFTGDEEMRGRGRGVVRGEKKREGSVEKQAGEKGGVGRGAGAEMRIKANPREGERERESRRGRI